MRRGAAFVAMLVLSLSAPTLAVGAAPQTSVTAIEGEVMCPICGTLLELSESPQAQREKVYVARLVAAGKSKAEIKDDLVAQYGPAVLALPKASGFDLTAYLIPVLAILAATIILAFGVSRWRRDAKQSLPNGATKSAPEGEAAERLEADLSRYDL